MSPVISPGGLGPQNRADRLGRVGRTCRRGGHSRLRTGLVLPAALAGKRAGWRGWQRHPGLAPGVRLAAWEQKGQAPELPPQPELLGAESSDGTQQRPASAAQRSRVGRRTGRGACPRGLQEEASKALILGLHRAWKARETWVGEWQVWPCPWGTPEASPDPDWAAPLALSGHSLGFRTPLPREMTLGLVLRDFLGERPQASDAGPSPAGHRPQPPLRVRRVAGHLR